MTQVAVGMASAVKWLRASYIAGAVADGLVGILMLIPDRMGETGFRYPMGLGASLMFGWAALLLWAYKSPVERKGVLVLTVFPVISGLVATGIWAGVSGLLPVSKIVPSSIVGIGLGVLMAFSYWTATVAEQRERRGRE
jgi:hypothetical protein